MAYESNESGRFEIYVRPFPDVNEGFQQVSGAGGVNPLWSRNGQELFYVQPGPPDRMMAVPVRTSATFDHDSPHALFEWPIVGTGGRNYDVSPDGRRFLVLKQAGSGVTESNALRPQIVIVENWTDELKPRAPVP